MDIEILDTLIIIELYILISIKKMTSKDVRAFLIKYGKIQLIFNSHNL